MTDKKRPLVSIVIYAVVMVGLLLLGGIIVSCVSSPQSTDTASSGSKDRPPAWMLDLKSVYPDTDYLAVIGIGDNIKAAQNDAVGNLSKIFKTTVVVETRAQLRYQEFTKDDVTTSKSDKDITQDVTLSSNETLYNVQFGESYVDKMGRVNIVAYLERRATAKIYREKIMKSSERIVQLMERNNKETGRIAKYALVNAAVVFSLKIQALTEHLMIIHPQTAQLLELPFRHGALKDMQMEAAAKMVFVVIIKNDEGGKVENLVKSLLTEQGFSISTSGKAELSVTGEIGFEPVTLENKYYNVKWFLNLDMTDERGNILVSMAVNQRESAVSESAAKSRAIVAIEKSIEKNFVNDFVKYLDNIAMN